MNIAEVLHNLLFDYTLRTVALGAGILGIVSGALGCFAMLRRQSLLGDSVSHTALPGIAVAFLLTGTKSPVMMILGAAVAGWLGTYAVIQIVRRSRIKTDTALGLILSVFFGFGLVLLTYIQKLPNSRQAGLEKFLFGQASALLVEDVITMGILGGIVILTLFFFWKEFKLLSFDPDFLEILGFPVRWIESLLTLILVIAIVIGLQTVGVVLMSAMVVAPAAAARQWTDRLSLMVVLAALFGAISGIAGAVISSLTAHLPTGPTIVLCISAIVIISITLAPNRGLFWKWLRQLNDRRRLALEAVLLDLYELSRQHADPQHPHSVETIRTMSFHTARVDKSLEILEEKNLARRIPGEYWAITDMGRAEAEKSIQNMERRT